MSDFQNDSQSAQVTAVDELNSIDDIKSYLGQRQLVDIDSYADAMAVASGFVRGGDLASAAVCAHLATTLRPESAAALRLLAIVRFDLAEYFECIDAIERIHEHFGVDRGLIEIYVNALTELKRFDEAEEFIDWAIDVWGKEKDLICAKAHLSFSQNRLLQTIFLASLVSLEESKDDIVGWELLASYALLGRPDLADEVLSIIGDDSDVIGQAKIYQFRGFIANCRREFGVACRWFERARELMPLPPDQEFTYFSCLALEGRWSDAWDTYHRRRESMRRNRLEGISEWRGEGLAGKRILVHAEQGLGDNIQFVRYLSPLAATGATVIYDTYPGLVDLFSEPYVGDDEYSADLRQVATTVDYQTWLLDIPGYLELPQLTMSSEAPYIDCPADSVAQAASVLGPKRLVRVGIVWSGNPDHKGDQHRSASLVDFSHLAVVPGVEWVSLKIDAARKELISADFPIEIRDLGEHARDLLGTSALLANVDLLISVDTGLAHLAGAMGLPVWLLLLDQHKEWRWELLGDKTVWYPTMRIFRGSNGWISLMQRDIVPNLATFVEDRQSTAESDISSGLRCLLASGSRQAHVDLNCFPDTSNSDVSLADLLAARYLALNFKLDIPLVRLCTQVSVTWGAVTRCMLAELRFKRSQLAAARDEWVAACREQTVPVALVIACMDTLLASGELGVATELAELCLLRQPSSSRLLRLLAEAKRSIGAPISEVGDLYARAVAETPMSWLTWWGLGQSWLDTGNNPAHATECFDRAIKLVHGDRERWSDLVFVAARLGYVDFASHQIKQRLANMDIQERIRVLPVLRKAGDLLILRSILEEVTDDVVKKSPPRALQALGNVTNDEHDAERFASHYREWLDRFPVPYTTDEQRNISLTLYGHYLQVGRISDAWEYLHRGVRELIQHSRLEWQPGISQGTPLLIFHNQGFGDLVQYLPVIIELAKNQQIVLAVFDAIADFLLVQNLNFDVVKLSEVSPDIWRSVPSAGLTRVLAVCAPDLYMPVMPAPYLTAAPLTNELADAIDDDGSLRIGLVWAGNAAHQGDFFRSSRLIDWVDMFSLPGVTLYSFQKDSASQQAIPYPFIKNIAPLLSDFSTSSAAIERMDAMVGVDTGLMHLAAAMGKQSHMVLPNRGRDPRWGTQGSSYPWYPSLRLYRSAEGQSWRSLISQLARKFC